MRVLPRLNHAAGSWQRTGLMPVAICFTVKTRCVRQQTVDSVFETYHAIPKQLGQNMSYTDATVSRPTLTITPQLRHHKAVQQHENAIKHHRQAALLLDSGDERQADTHANIAFSHAVSALETSGMALKT